VPQREPLPETRHKLRRKKSIPNLKELVSQIAPENRYEEISSGPARGKVSIEEQLCEEQLWALRRDIPFSS
jgi:hypothetical protein